LPPKKRSVSECLQLAFWADQRESEPKAELNQKKRAKLHMTGVTRL